MSGNHANRINGDKTKISRRTLLASLIASPVALLVTKRKRVPTVSETIHYRSFPLALHPILSVNEVWIEGKFVYREPKTFTYPMVTLPYKNN